MQLLLGLGATLELWVDAQAQIKLLYSLPAPLSNLSLLQVRPPLRGLLRVLQASNPGNVLLNMQKHLARWVLRHMAWLASREAKPAMPYSPRPPSSPLNPLPCVCLPIPPHAAGTGCCPFLTPTAPPLRSC